MKRFIPIFLITVLSICLSHAFCFAAETDTVALQEAESLKSLNLFNGLTDTNFALEQKPTRVQALVMLVRLLGKEEEAKNSACSHPFTDVPTWAEKYVAYAYENGITKGTSATTFGTGNANANMYTTFVLRSLGYSDSDNADFSYSDPYSLAENIGIDTERISKSNFLRSDVVKLSYDALDTQLKDSETTLADKLISEGVFTEYDYNEAVLGEEIELTPNAPLHKYINEFEDPGYRKHFISMGADDIYDSAEIHGDYWYDNTSTGKYNQLVNYILENVNYLHMNAYLQETSHIEKECNRVDWISSYSQYKVAHFYGNNGNWQNTNFLGIFSGGENKSKERVNVDKYLFSLDRDIYGYNLNQLYNVYLDELETSLCGLEVYFIKDYDPMISFFEQSGFDKRIKNDEFIDYDMDRECVLIERGFNEQWHYYYNIQKIDASGIIFWISRSCFPLVIRL